MKTKAAVLTELKKPLEIWELEIPPLKEGQVLVKIAFSGLCQAQLNEARGHKGEDKFLPHTLGHEGSGVVLEVGQGVTKVKAGDHVVLSWIKGTGKEIPNTAYKKGERVVNSGAISTFLTHAVISENRVIPIPKSVPFREAALLGCAIPTGCGAIQHEMKLSKDQTLALFGMGGIGLAAQLIAASLGAKTIAVDVSAEKLEQAKLCGATYTINAATTNPVDEIFKITQGQGVDFAFEAAGKKITMEQAFASLKAPKGLAVLAGNLPKGQKIELDPFDLIRGKEIRGTWGGGSKIDEDIPHFIKSFQEGRLPLANLITHEIELEEINDLLDALEQGKVGRGIIRF